MPPSNSQPRQDRWSWLRRPVYRALRQPSRRVIVLLVALPMLAGALTFYGLGAGASAEKSAADSASGAADPPAAESAPPGNRARPEPVDNRPYQLGALVFVVFVVLEFILLRRARMAPDPDQQTERACRDQQGADQDRITDEAADSSPS